MEKTYYILAFAILVISHLHAQVFTQGDLKYAVNGEESVAVIGCSTTPSSILRIPTNIIYNNTSLRVNAIRARAFAGQNTLMTVMMPAQLDTIGHDAFYRCQKLRNLMGLSKVDVCESYAFSMTGLTSLDWSQITVGTLGDGVFAQCKQLAEVNLPAELEVLPEAIFHGCKALTSIDLSSLPLTRIEPRAFYQCSSLQGLELPSTLVEIGDQAFADMTALASIELPAGITTIGAQAFAGCQTLQSITLPEQLVSLGYSPFAGCNQLRDVILPAKISDIDDKFIFADCPALEEISIADGARYYSCSDGVLRNRIGSMIVAYPPVLSRQVHPTLRATSQPLAPGALMGCELEEFLLLPAQVNSVPREAFAGTTGLRSIEMATRSSLTTIGIRAFENSRDLTYVFIPNKMKSIDNAAFRGAFNIREVFSLASSVPALADSAFSKTVYDNSILHTPTDKSMLYEEAQGWCLFNHILDDNVTNIAQTTTDDRQVFYNLQGVRVSNPRKGIFIVNTKKKVIKL